MDSDKTQMEVTITKKGVSEFSQVLELGKCYRFANGEILKVSGRAIKIVKSSYEIYL